ncbi:urea transporter [Gordonia sp. (in: high G+C Gram-positive bacteria)]|uniref:urea transporter n=1 Tax=Gordonia sp. (in: high G+C Gram-positive bacteria) TaxID=84139 RepID=UPI0039E599C0
MSESTAGPGARWTRLTDRLPAARIADVTLRGSGQVMFQANALTGLLFLVGIGYGAIAADSPQVVIGALIGLVVSTLTALALQPDTSTMRAGLYGYNGILVGAALPTFLADNAWLWPYVVVGAAASTVAFMATARVFKTWGVPALTFPFNLVNWVLLLGAFKFAALDTNPLGDAHLPTDGATNDAAAYVDVTASWLLEVLFKNVAQVFLINNWVTGVIFVVAIAVSSLTAAALALAGSAVAIGVSLALGAPAVDIGNGIYGFSAVLTAIALGCVFYTPGPRVLAYALLGVVTTVIFHAGLATLLAAWALPAGTGPFVFATWLFLLAKKKFRPVHHETLPVDG